MSIQVVRTIASLALMVVCASTAQAHDPKAVMKSAANRQLRPKVECNSLAGRVIPASKIALPTKGATIKSAELKPATGPEVLAADMVPEYCNIEGAIAPIDPTAPSINFRVAIPTVWNGKSFQIGGNGRDGFIPNLAWLARNKPGSPIGPAFPPNRQFPIAQGYATYGSDSGHGGALPPDQTVAGPVAGGDGIPPGQRGGEGIPQGVTGRGRGRGGAPQAEAWNTNDEAYTNFAYAAIKKTHDAAMEIISQMYGSKPSVNYFTGESQGGREALAALTHYPDDYDGVIASVPLAYYTGTRLSRVAMWAKTQSAPGAWLPPAKAPAISKEVLGQCDALDGLEDGVINNYVACNRKFDGNPDALTKIRCADGADTGNDCLSDAQIATWNMYHSPMKWGFPMNEGETEWPAEPVGAEASPQYILLPRKPDPVPGASDLLTERYGDPEKYNLTTHTFAEMKDQLQALSKEIDASSDWSKYLSHGGKLIFYTGGDDYTTNARTQMHLYDMAVKRLGQASVDKFVRYYVAPNVNHGSIGVSATTGKPLPRYTDMLTYLQDWVERGVTPPDALTQTLMADKPPYAVERSRPICRYPNYPRYKGMGDPDKMDSYTCTAP